MSYVEIFSFGPDGIADSHDEVRNASAGAMMIWSKLLRKYAPDVGVFAPETFDALNEAMPRMETWEAVLLVSTYDHVVTRRENLEQVAGAWQRFHEEYVEGTTYDNTAERVAESLRSALADEDVAAVAFNQTSVCSAYWWVQEDDDDDECRGYDLNKDEDHSFMSEDLGELTAGDDDDEQPEDVQTEEPAGAG